MPAAVRMQNKKWVIKPPHENCANFAKSVGISNLVAQVLLNRGISDHDSAKVFLSPKLNALLPPEQMPGVPQAAKIIKTAIQNNKKITIYGDYDVDGITSTAILLQVINLLGGNADYYIPHRVDEGYGLNPEAVRTIAKLGTNLIITVDCGISAIESAALAQQLGIELIITDHHQPDPTLPHAAAIVHPALDPAYPNQNSCGAMVAFKLAWALANDFNNGCKLSDDLRQFMLNATSLAAMGTIADVMDLRGENRILTNYGLKSLSQSQLHGVQALIDTAGLTDQSLDSFHIGFRLAPMLNAAGRMGHARLAVDLLTSQTRNNSMQIAEYLKQQNDQRRKIERQIFKEACEQIHQNGLNHPDRKSIVLACESWHVGVIGIVASKIVDKYFKPVIMINSANGVSHGSARSIPGFDVLAAITSCSEHLTAFGGHKMAAGVTLATDNIQTFAEKIEAYADKNISHIDIVEKVDIDSHARLDQLTMNTVEQLNSLAPFGQGNPRPVFVSKGLRLAGQPRKVGAKGDHLQITVTDNTNTIKCVGFGMGKFEKKLLEKDFFDAVYEPDINTFNGSSNVQLIISDIQFD